MSGAPTNKTADMGAAISACDNYRYKRRVVHEPVAMIRNALRALSRHRLVLVPNDKETGFTAVHRDDFVAEQIATMRKSWYAEEAPHMAELQKLSLQYCKLTKRVEALEAEEDLSSELRKSLVDSTAIAMLQLTVKTLKAPGEMTTRPIHSASRYAFAGLARWVSKQFRSQSSRTS